MEHHRLDPYPIPKDKTPLCINEPWLIDKSLLEYPPRREPDEKEDNVRIYVPMDLNRAAILRRLDRVIAHNGEATEENEMEFSVDVGMIVSQVEIYDQVWFVRHVPEKGEHSNEAKELVGKVVTGAFAIGGTVLLIFKDVPSLVAGVAKTITNKKL